MPRHARERGARRPPAGESSPMARKQRAARTRRATWGETRDRLGAVTHHNPVDSRRPRLAAGSSFTGAERPVP